MTQSAAGTGPWLAALGGCVLLALPARAEPPGPSVAAIDRQLADHWRAKGVTPAAPADDPTVLRRVTLDLAGRAPTAREVAAFAADPDPEKYAALVGRLVRGPEFAWYFATVLDEVIQGRLAGGEPFVTYLRAALRAGKGWDAIFREVLVGPWDTDARRPAAGFLDRRVKDLDALTVDTTRAFFGVDISCARCHNHPLVKDWKRDHYYGMAAFLVRTAGGKGSVTEKADGEARFAGKDGKEQVAPIMFLTGRTVADPAKPREKDGRRAALVRVALEDRAFLSRAFVNRVWEHFFGRGLVDPVDQMHSGNPASVPALLDRLADDFAASGYDVGRLVTAVALSRAYRLDTHWAGNDVPDPGHFAVARLRPLSPRQLARSLVLVLGDGTFDGTPEQLTALDKRAGEPMPVLDPRTGDFQSSAREALFVSNAGAVRKLVAGSGLVERLAKIGDDRDLVRAAVRAVLARPATAGEAGDLESWLKRHAGDRKAACEDLVWALMASAEFRFNH